MTAGDRRLWLPESAKPKPPPGFQEALEKEAHLLDFGDSIWWNDIRYVVKGKGDEGVLIVPVEIGRATRKRMKRAMKEAS